MTTTYKPLGQVNTIRHEPTKLYSVPNNKEVVIRSINITNPTEYDSSYSIAFTPTSSFDGTMHDAFVGLGLVNSSYKISTDLITWSEVRNQFVGYTHDGISDTIDKTIDHVNGIFFDLSQDVYGHGASFQASTDGVNWKTFPITSWTNQQTWYRILYRPSSQTYFAFSLYFTSEFRFNFETGVEFVNEQDNILTVNSNDGGYGIPDVTDKVKFAYSEYADKFIMITSMDGANWFYPGIAVSTDGFTWESTYVASDNFPGNWMPGALEVVEDTIVVASNNFVDFWVAYSKDGEIWTELWFPYDDDFINFKNIAFNNNTMVMQSSGTWYQYADITPKTIKMFFAGIKGNLYQGDPHGYMFSDNGIDWYNAYIANAFDAQYNNGDLHIDYSSYIMPGNGWVTAMSDYWDRMYTTVDGITWIPVEGPSGLSNPSYVQNGNITAFIGYYEPDNVWPVSYSTDGINWNSGAGDFGFDADPYTENYQRLAYGNDYYVLTSDSSSLWVSTDLITWDYISFDGNPVSIAFDSTRNQFVVCDGVNITTFSDPYDSMNTTYVGGNPLTKIIIDNNGNYNIIDDGTTDIVLSTDGGETWTTIYLPMDPWWGYSGDYHPTMGDNGTWAMMSQDFTIYSTDGFTWSFGNTNQDFNSNQYTSWNKGDLSNMGHVTLNNARSFWAFNKRGWYNNVFTNPNNNFHQGEGGGQAIVYGNGLWYWIDSNRSLTNTYSTDLITWSGVSNDWAYGNGNWAATFGHALIKPNIPDSDYIVKDATILAGETVTIKSGYTLGSGNSIVVYGSDRIGFSAFGAEIG